MNSYPLVGFVVRQCPTGCANAGAIRAFQGGDGQAEDGSD